MRNSSRKMVGDAKSVKNLSIQKKFMNIICENMMVILNVQSAKKNFAINRAWIFISSYVEKATTKLISKNTSVTNAGKSLVRNRNSNSTWVSCFNPPFHDGCHQHHFSNVNFEAASCNLLWRCNLQSNVSFCSRSALKQLLEALFQICSRFRLLLQIWSLLCNSFRADYSFTEEHSFTADCS